MEASDYNVNVYEPPILRIWVAAMSDGTAYKWEIIEHGIDGKTNRTIGSGMAPTLIEAARDGGNAMYDAWGYASSMGRLAIVGEERQVISDS